MTCLIAIVAFASRHDKHLFKHYIVPGIGALMNLAELFGVVYLAIKAGGATSKDAYKALGHRRRVDRDRRGVGAVNPAMRGARWSSTIRAVGRGRRPAPDGPAAEAAIGPARRQADVRRPPVAAASWRTTAGEAAAQDTAPDPDGRRVPDARTSSWRRRATSDARCRRRSTSAAERRRRPASGGRRPTWTRPRGRGRLDGTLGPRRRRHQSGVPVPRCLTRWRRPRRGTEPAPAWATTSRRATAHSPRTAAARRKLSLGARSDPGEGPAAQRGLRRRVRARRPPTTRGTDAAAVRRGRRHGRPRRRRGGQPPGVETRSSPSGVGRRRRSGEGPAGRRPGCEHRGGDEACREAAGAAWARP